MNPLLRCAEPGCERPGETGPYTGSTEYCLKHWRIADRMSDPQHDAVNNYERLRFAVLAYDAALAKAGQTSLGHWAESAELERLYDAILEACGLDPATHGAPDA